MRRVVLDSWATLAFLLDEPAAAEVEALLRAAQAGEASLGMCVVNVGEVLYRMERIGGNEAPGRALDALRDLPIEFVDVGLELTEQAAALKATTPVSFADCFAAAVAISRDAELATGDPEFARFGPPLQVLWLSRI